LNTRRVVALLAIAAFLLSACRLGAAKIIRGSGDLITESGDVSDFDRVSLTCSGDVVITQGEEESLTIETDDNIIEYVMVEVRSGTLELSIKKGVNISPTRFRFTLSVKDLDELSVSGSGDVTADSLITDRLAVKVSGSGDVRVDSLAVDRMHVQSFGSGDVRIDALTADIVDLQIYGSGGAWIDALATGSVDVEIFGSGDVELSGEVDQQDIGISGSGDYRGGDLRGEMAEVTINGSGDVTVWVTESLDARSNGSGTLNYYGDPQTSFSRSSSGEILSLGDR
jgi:hypothetical protein